MTVTVPAREHPQLASLWREAESRHLTDEELQLYVEVWPEAAERAQAAREVRAAEAQVVKTVVQTVFDLYPYEQHHELATAKCTRDVRYVSAYATMAMLMDDGTWLDDKLLIWLKTILQSFSFPDRVQKRKVLFASRGTDPDLDRLDAKRRSIHDTYSRLRDGYQKALGERSFALMQPHLQQVIDTLTED